VKALSRPSASLGSFNFSIPRRSVRNKGAKEFVGCLRDLLHGAIESDFVSLGGLRETTKFPDELQRRRVNFFVSRRRFEVMQGLDISTHSISLYLALESIIF
jgi:hypothetical protein